MTERKKYLLCPQCGSRRLMLKDADGQKHFVYIFDDHSIVYAKTGEPISADLDTSTIWCADCSWRGTLKKLVRYWTQ